MACILSVWCYKPNFMKLPPSKTYPISISYCYFIIAIIFCITISCRVQTNVEVQADYLIKDVSIIDVINGKTLENHNIAINGTEISLITDKDILIRNNENIIDGKGKYLIPGLWDMHAHVSISYEYQIGLNIANGVLGLRELWGLPDSIQIIRERINKGDILDIGLVASGNLIDGKPAHWPGSTEIDDVSEVETVLNEQADRGADFFKVYSKLPRDVYFAIAEHSKKLGIPFAGHVPESVSLFEAIDAGQLSAEHLMVFLASCSSESDKIQNTPGFSSFFANKIDLVLETFDTTKFLQLVDKLSESNTWIVPTLTVKRNIAYLNDTSRFSLNPEKNPLIKVMPPYVNIIWGNPEIYKQLYGTNFFESNQKRFEKELSLVKILQEKGVKLLAGTDYPNPFCYPGYSLHEELEILADCGLSNAESLRTATYNPALFFGKESHMGSIETGKLANLVLLEGNPLEDIRNTKKINSVFLKGDYLDRKRLDDLISNSIEIAANEKYPMDLTGFPLKHGLCHH